MGRQALKIIESGSLNLKTEFGANHLCRLQSSASDWEKEKILKEQEREKREIQENIKNFALVMSSIRSIEQGPAIQLTNELSFSRSIKSNTERKRNWTRSAKGEKEEAGVVRSKRRKMDSSTPMRGAQAIMAEDEDLLSPIPQPHPTQNQATTTNSSDGSGDFSNIPDASARTNISDPLRALNFGERTNRRNNTSTEFWIECLCLEDAALRRGVLHRRTSNPLEWLDLRAAAENMTRDVNVNDWSTNSFGSIQAPLAASSSSRATSGYGSGVYITPARREDSNSNENDIDVNDLEANLHGRNNNGSLNIIGKTPENERIVNINPAVNAQAVKEVLS